MITRRTRVQLLVFVVITLLGVSYVGARYARLDKLVRDDTYTVVAHFESSGGIFADAEVDYRGVKIGQVSKLELVDEGVDVYLDVEDDFDDIPKDSMAVVANRSAVGEQYVDLQPQVDDGPYLENDSEIPQSMTRTPVATEKLLSDLATTVGSVDRASLRTTILELGDAFSGTGPDLQRIIDTGNSFIQAANDNFDTTTKLLRDSDTVLDTQIASESSLRTFADQLSKFSRTLASSDPDLRKVIDNGSFAANQVRGLIEDNRVELADLLNNLITSGRVVVKNLPGIEQVLVIYPYVVEGGYTVVSKSPDTGLYDAHFGLIITDQPICQQGYGSSDRRPPQNTGNRPMNTKAKCTEPASMSNARGAQNLNRVAPVVASYDAETHHLKWGDRVDPTLSSPGTVAPRAFGKESWKWMFVEPMTGR